MNTVLEPIMLNVLGRRVPKWCAHMQTNAFLQASIAAGERVEDCKRELAVRSRGMHGHESWKRTSRYNFARDDGRVEVFESIDYPGRWCIKSMLPAPHTLTVDGITVRLRDMRKAILFADDHIEEVR